MSEEYNQLTLLSDLLDEAKKQGATSADAVIFNAAALSVSCRMGALEKLERAESNDLGLRVFIDKQQAIVSSTDFKPSTLSEVVSRAVSMAKAAPKDEFCGIAEPHQIVTSPPKIDICDETEPTNDALINAAIEAEDAALSVKGITNSEGAETGWSHSKIAIAATNGLEQSYRTSSHSLAVSVLAGQNTEMERDYDYTSAVYREDLKDPKFIGNNAAIRAVKRLSPKKKETQQVPVVFEPRISGGILRHYVGAINGAAVARGTSFLKDSMGKQVFPKNINIFDDPHRLRGLRSKPFDAEGLPNTCRQICEDGILTGWVLDLAASRQLNIDPTGNAARGTASPPSPAVTNVYMDAGEEPPSNLIADIENGFYVTELIGMGVNLVTGDYSRGATGFWIENGEITYPVSEMTIAGNLSDMFKNLTRANDLQFQFGTDAPTIRIEGMTVAGV